MTQALAKRPAGKKPTDPPKRRFSLLKWGSILLLVVGGGLALGLQRNTSDAEPQEDPAVVKARTEKLEREKRWASMDRNALLKEYVATKEKADKGNAQAIADLPKIQAAMNKAMDGKGKPAPGKLPPGIDLGKKPPANKDPRQGPTRSTDTPARPGDPAKHRRPPIKPPDRERRKSGDARPPSVP